MKKLIKRIASVLTGLAVIFSVGFFMLPEREEQASITASAESLDYPHDINNPCYMLMYGDYWYQIGNFSLYGKFGNSYYWTLIQVFFNFAADDYGEFGDRNIFGDYALIRVTRQAGSVGNVAITYMDFRVNTLGSVDGGFIEITTSHQIGGIDKPNGSIAT